MPTKKPFDLATDFAAQSKTVSRFIHMVLRRITKKELIEMLAQKDPEKLVRMSALLYEKQISAAALAQSKADTGQLSELIEAVRDIE
ncbi:MAG: hypothetical protein IJC25_00950 [Clostridia bacterium]|nr:hypothetical protein [Clostridia bacterium]